MKKIIILFLIIVCAFVLLGCTTEQELQTIETPKLTEEPISESTLEQKTEDDAPDEAENDNTDVLDDTEDSDATEEQTEEELDKSLTGVELLRALKTTRIDSLAITTDSENVGEGINWTTTAYTKGDISRIEVQYSGELNGNNSLKFYDHKEKKEYIFMGGDEEKASFRSSYKDMPIEVGFIYFDDIDPNQTGQEFVARIEELNGEETVFMETSTVDDTGIEYIVRMWFTLEHGIVIKTETYISDNLFLSSVTTDYDVNGEIDDEMFPDFND